MECVKILQLQAKLKMMFDKLAEPDYVMDNYYADGLINKLTNLEDSDVAFLDKAPVMSDLIIETLNLTDNAHNTVKVFLTRIIAIAAQKELHFAKIFYRQRDKILSEFKQISSPNMNSSLRVAYLEVALTIVKHDSGLSWLLETGLWKEILSLCSQKTTVFVVRQTYKFMTEFLWRLSDVADAQNISLVINTLIQPISRLDFLNFQSMTTEEEEEICRNIEPMLQILLCIVGKERRITKSTLLMSVLIKDVKITSYLFIACDRLRKEDVSLLIVKLIFWLIVSKTFLSKPLMPGITYTSEDFLEVTASNFNIIHSLIQRRSATLMLDFCAACNIIWTEIWKEQEACYDTNGKMRCRNQMLFLCIVPILVFVTHGKSESATSDEPIKVYIASLLNTSCEYTTRAAYGLRDLTKELGIVHITKHSVKNLICLKEHLNDEQANILFQALFYALQGYSPVDNVSGEPVEMDYDESQEKNLVMTYVIDTVLSLVKHRNINWSASLEIICLYNIVYYILQRPDLTTKFIVIALNVIRQTVNKFLTPNLSLLLDSKPGSAIHELGKVIYMKMHHVHWEIRDTALELLLDCTEISYIKFPPFQKQIIDNNLINVAATIAFNDFEPYVQVSALKCIGAASKVAAIWEHLVAEFPDIHERVLVVLRRNEEGMVRREACNVLCELYQNSILTPTFKQILYEHMVSTVLSDFHWEVQLSSLKFWKNTYRCMLTNQGMLDGKFPPVTFSKETRKIVTLNEAEVQKRLIKILDKLAAIGCLTVLVKLVYDESDLEIMEAALATSLELIELLYEHKVTDCLKPRDDDPKSVKDLMCQIKEELDEGDKAVDMTEPQNQENVLEDILNADDVNLLANIYERHMTLQSNAVEPPLKPKIKLPRLASPYLFVKFFTSTDHKLIIEEKRKWNVGIKSLSSLLDDVLGCYEVNEEANSLDCY